MIGNTKMHNMETIAECVGGCCDGVQLDPPDKDEPDDWPDYIEIENKETGTIGFYTLNYQARVIGGRKTYLYEIT